MKNQETKCPDHLYSSKQYFVESISFDGVDHVADLPNLDDGWRILISEDVFNKIRQLWRENRSVILNIGAGTIRKDHVMIPSTVSVSEDLPEDSN